MSQEFLYSEIYDFELYEKKPISTVCLFFVPRSGSTLLACLMQQTMALGFPLEYFEVINLAALAKRLPDFSFSNPDPLIRVRTSPNGIFSFKLSNLLTEKDKDDLLDLLDTKHFLIIDRQDQEAQVRSLAIAIQTKKWVQLRGEEAANIPQVSESSLLKARSILENDREAIRNFVSNRKISALSICYEDLLSQPRHIIGQVCDFLNVQSYQDVDINKVPIRRQSKFFS